jgi:hypothetical protein
MVRRLVRPVDSSAKKEIFVQQRSFSHVGKGVRNHGYVWI